ncbi:MAG: MBL fold metallo-hydrolase, partial [Lachnospiraceae bacterium]|nr:MBL fold metallo-hydrolase [Lachnospiraceae bacterium]
THGHFDHIFGCNSLRKLSGVPIYAYRGEQKLLEDPSLNVSDQVGRPYTVNADHYLEDGEMIEIADMKIELIATPGHTAGSCCFYIREAGLLISGDTLFEESVGRSDLPTGSGAELGRSVTEKLFILPDETKVYPGHGDSTTIGHEKQYNPFF